MPAISLLPVIECLMLDDQIRNLEDGLVAAELIGPDNPLLPAGKAILNVMKREQARRQDVYVAMLATDPEVMDALVAADNIRRDLFRNRPEEFR